MMTKRLLTLAALLALAFAALPAAAVESKPVFQGRAEASYVRTSGNTDTETFAGKLEASYEPSANRYYGKAGALYGKTDGDATANQWHLEGRYERALTERLFAFAAATYVNDDFSGYKYQATVGPGLGYEFLKTDRHHLKGLASILYAYDKFDDGESDSYAAGQVQGDYTWQITETTKFRELATYRVSLEDASVYFATSETSLEVKVASNVSLGVGYLIGYRNQPPAGSEYTDRTFLTSLIVTY